MTEWNKEFDCFVRRVTETHRTGFRATNWVSRVYLQWIILVMLLVVSWHCVVFVRRITEAKCGIFETNTHTVDYSKI